MVGTPKGDDRDNGRRQSAGRNASGVNEGFDDVELGDLPQAGEAGESNRKGGTTHNGGSASGTAKNKQCGEVMEMRRPDGEEQETGRDKDVNPRGVWMWECCF